MIIYPVFFVAVLIDPVGCYYFLPAFLVAH